LSLPGYGRLVLSGERGFELIEQPAHTADHLRRVGAVPDDLGQGQYEQAVEVSQLPLDPHRAAGIHSQAGRIGSLAGNGQEIADAIDGLYPRRRIVDGRGQRAYRDIDELPEAERRVLHEGAFSADEEEPGDIPVVQVPAVHERDGGAVGQVLAYS